jgi:hypothetical protein
LHWAIIGALLGGLFTALDGAVLGAIFGAAKDGSGRPAAALRWAGYFSIIGTVLGALLGGLARAIGPGLVLRPPGEEEEGGPRQRSS